MTHLGLVHTNVFSFENTYFSLRFGLPSTLRQRFLFFVFSRKTELFGLESGF